ncbi:MFS transporter [Thozetella sp. PMI_491]|nr:MFS transporter [Thozetella sp. PMI_491]
MACEANYSTIYSIIRKIDYRLLPTTATIYLLCYLDRSNIGNAKILNSSTGNDLMTTTGMNNQQYIVALMLFMVAYTIFEAPSNMALKILSPKRWLGFLVFAFGALCIGIGGAHNAETITALRFLLGAAEAGVFPGMIYYFSFWYRPRERASRIAAFLCSATLSGAFGGCIAYGVGHMNGAGGIQAWRWLFIIEGIPSGKPTQTRMTEANEVDSEQKINWVDAKACLTDPRMYAHYLAYFGIGSCVASLSLFSPTIVAGMGYKDLEAQLYTVPPYAVAYVVTLGAAWLSDRYQTRGLIAGISFTIGLIAFIVSATISGNVYVTRYVMLILATTGVFGGLPSLCAWVGDNSRTTTAAALSTALNIGLSGPSQIIGVWIYRAQDAPFYRLGHSVNAAMISISMVASFGLTFYYRRQNAKMAGTNQQRWIP